MPNQYGRIWELPGLDMGLTVWDARIVLASCFQMRRFEP